MHVLAKILLVHAKNSRVPEFIIVSFENLLKVMKRQNYKVFNEITSFRRHIMRHPNLFNFTTTQIPHQFDILWQNMAENRKKTAQHHKSIELLNILFLFIFYQWAILDSNQ